MIWKIQTFRDDKKMIKFHVGHNGLVDSTVLRKLKKNNFKKIIFVEKTDLSIKKKLKIF